MDGKTEAKGPDSLIYEPFTFLAFNINPEGVAAMLPGAPPKTQ